MEAAAVARRAGNEQRYLGAGLLTAGAVWSLLPVHPPLACPLRATTGVPCPLCGATRAVVAGVHGDIVASLRYNPIGLAAIALAIAMVVGFRFRYARLANWVVPAALGVLWAYNVTLNPTF